MSANIHCQMSLYWVGTILGDATLQIKNSPANFLDGACPYYFLGLIRASTVQQTSQIYKYASNATEQIRWFWSSYRVLTWIRPT